MDTNPHTLSTLFEQLGLPSSDADIARFVAEHRPLDPALDVAQAPFWNVSQAAFLSEALEADAAWAEAVDELSSLLR